VEEVRKASKGRREKSSTSIQVSLILGHPAKLNSTTSVVIFVGLIPEKINRTSFIPTSKLFLSSSWLLL